MPGLSGLTGNSGLSGIMGTAFAGAYDDIPNLEHIYEPARRTLTAYVGNLVRLRRASDNAELDFGFLANGDLDVVAIAAWAGGTSNVVTIYDQIGNDNITQGTKAQQPAYTASAQNGKPGMTVTAAAMRLNGAFTNGGALSQPFTYYAVAQLDAAEVNNGTRNTLFYDNDGAGTALLATLTAPAPDQWYLSAGVALGTGDAADATWNVWSVLFNGASSEIWRDTVSLVSGNAGANNPNGVTWFAFNTGGGDWVGLGTMLAIADPSHSGAERASMQIAINNYWAVY